MPPRSYEHDASVSTASTSILDEPSTESIMAVSDIPMSLDGAASLFLELEKDEPPSEPVLEMEDIELETSNDLDDSTHNKENSQRKSVVFADLHIREYSQVLGEHPCCTLGPPISLGWEYAEARTISLDEYESTRSPRRSRQQMRLSWDQRRSILSDFSDGEVRRVARKLQRDRDDYRRDKRHKSFFFEENHRDFTLAFS